MGTERQRSQLERPERDTLERHDRMADRLAHPPDLAVAAFVDGDQEGARGQAAHASRSGRAVVEPHAAAQLAYRALADRRPAHRCPVPLLDLEARMGQPVGELAVVGEQNEPGAVDVEPAHRVEAKRRADQPHHGPAALGIGRGRDDTERFVERDHHLLAHQLNRFAVHGHARVRGDVGGDVGDRCAVDRDSPLADDLLRRAAGADAGVGEKFGDSHRAAKINHHGSRRSRPGTRRRRPARLPRPAGVAVDGPGRR